MLPVVCVDFKLPKDLKLGSKPIVCLKQSLNLQSFDALVMTETCG